MTKPRYIRPEDVFELHQERQNAERAAQQGWRPWAVGRKATCPSCSTTVKLIGAINKDGGKPLEPTLFLRWDRSEMIPREAPVDFLDFSYCPECSQLIIARGERLILPRPSRTAPPEVPADIAQDYHEASTVLVDSPRASAALARRCLQLLLRDVAKVTPDDLSKEIDQVLADLPAHLRDIDAIRHVGNFATHPNKDKHTGDVLPVEPGEAEWLLDILDRLFDHYCVGPALAAKRRAELDAKLATSGKPPMKA